MRVRKQINKVSDESLRTVVRSAGFIRGSHIALLTENEYEVLSVFYHGDTVYYVLWASEICSLIFPSTLFHISNPEIPSEWIIVNLSGDSEFLVLGPRYCSESMESFVDFVNADATLRNRVSDSIMSWRASSVGQIVTSVWDPFGISDLEDAINTYAELVDRLNRYLLSRPTITMLESFLTSITTEELGIMANHDNITRASKELHKLV